jgi:hypothetical protein
MKAEKKVDKNLTTVSSSVDENKNRKIVERKLVLR